MALPIWRVAAFAFAATAVGASTAAARKPVLSPKTSERVMTAAAELRDATQQAWQIRRQQLDGNQLKAIENLGRTIRANPGQLFVTWSPFGSAHQLWSPLVDIPVEKLASQAPADIARAFLNAHVDLFAISAEELILIKPPQQVSSVRFTQRATDGRPVFAAEAHVNVGPGGVHLLTANLLPDDALPPPAQPRLTAAEAMLRAGKRTTDAVLGYYAPAFFGDSSSTDVFRAWRVHVLDGPERFVYIDDATGDLLAEAPLAVPEADRQVFFCNDCSPPDLPGLLEFSDVCVPASSDAPPDPAACLSPRLECVDLAASRFCQKAGGVPLSGTSGDVNNALGQIEFYFEAGFGRLSWSWPWLLTMHGIRASSDANFLTYGSLAGSRPRFDDCHSEWRSLAMVEAPGQIALGSRRACRSVLAHEYLHGIFDARGGLAPLACTEARAIEQGYGDVFGEFIEAQFDGRADWVLGTDCPDCGLISRSSLDTPFARPCAPTRVGCRDTLVDPAPLTPPDTWSFYRPVCTGEFNSTIVNKIGFLMGRDSAEGVASHGGINVTGIGRAAAAVWYSSEESLLSSTSGLSDLRVALLDGCARRLAGGAVADCASAAEAVGIWSPDVMEPITLDQRPVGGSGLSRSAALGDRPGESYAFFYRPPEREATAGDLMFQRRSCTLLEECAWEAPRIWRRAIVGPDRIVPQTPSVTRRPAPSGGDELWVCYRDSGFSCDFVDDAGRHAGIVQPPIDIDGDVSAAVLRGNLHVVFKNGSRGLMLWTFDPAHPATPPRMTPILDGGVPLRSVVAPVLASGVIDDAGTRALVVGFVRAGTDEPVAARIDEATGRLLGAWGLLDGSSSVLTSERPALAVFHNRIHLVVVDGRREFRVDGRRRIDRLGANTLLVQTVNAPPAISSDESPIVDQTGFFVPSFSLYEGVGGALHFIHRSSDGTRVMRRFKMSR